MLTNLLLNLGLTRDWAGWLWGRLISGATIVMALYALNGDNTFSGYVTPHELKALIVVAVVVMWLAGKYDSSELPGASAAPKAAGSNTVKVGVWLLPLLIATALLSTACASAMTQVVHATTSAINEVPKLQCGQPTAPAAPACLNHAQYTKVNQELAAATEAELAYTQLQAGVASAQGQTLAQATITIVSSLTAALNDIVVAVGDVSNTAAQQLKTALAKL